MTYAFPGFAPNTPVIVTGAASGIGEATVALLRKFGMKVIGVDIDADRLAALDPSGGSLHAEITDTGDPAAIEALFARLSARFGAIPHLVNNAGPPSSMDLSIEQGLALSAGSVQRMTAAWADQLGDSPQASVVNIASVAGALSGGPSPHLLAGRGGAEMNGWYPAGKAAIAGLTRWQAVSAAGLYRANAVLPGVTITARMEDIATGIYGREVIGRTPLGRLARPDEIANAIVFLLSPAASFVNGQSLAVEGGGILAF